MMYAASFFGQGPLHTTQAGLRVLFGQNGQSTQLCNMFQLCAKEPLRRLRPSKSADGSATVRCGDARYLFDKHWKKQPEVRPCVPMPHSRGTPFRGHWLGSDLTGFVAVGS